MELFKGIHLYRSGFRAQLVQNLLLGLFISVLLWNFQSVGFIDDLESFSLDWVTRIQQFQVDSDNGHSYAVLDIDDASWRKWNNPLYMPRKKLLNIIDYATNSRAKVVVVDLDLGSTSDRVEDDLALQNFLENYDRLPQLILIKPVWKKKGEYHVSPSFLDKAVNENDLVHWGSAYFQIDDKRQVRRGHLSIELHDRSVISSVQSLIASNLEQSRTTETMQQWIFFRLPWDIPEGVRVPLIQNGDRMVSLYEVRSVLPLTESTGDVSDEWLRDQIVLIGSSVQFSNDSYLTSLGPMPGYFVIANAIHSYLEMGVVKRPPLWITLLIELLAITLMSYSFARFTSFSGLLISSVLFVIAVIPVSLWLLQMGMWFNLVLPLLTVQIMHFIYRIDDYFRYRHA